MGVKIQQNVGFRSITEQRRVFAGKNLGTWVLECDALRPNPVSDESQIFAQPPVAQFTYLKMRG